MKTIWEKIKFEVYGWWLIFNVGYYSIYAKITTSNTILLRMQMDKYDNAIRKFQMTLVELSDYIEKKEKLKKNKRG